jgi:hypothetical protein
MTRDRADKAVESRRKRLVGAMSVLEEDWPRRKGGLLMHFLNREETSKSSSTRCCVRSERRGTALRDGRPIINYNGRLLMYADQTRF